MPLAHSPHAPFNLARIRATGVCDRCNFLYPLDDFADQKQWAGTSMVTLGLLVCPRCLDEPQQNGLRTIVIGPDPAPLKRARPPHWAQQAAPSLAPQFVLDDVLVNSQEGDFSGDDFLSDDFSTSSSPTAAPGTRPLDAFTLDRDTLA